MISGRELYLYPLERMASILAYLRKDILLEVRRGYAFSGLLIFVLSTAYIIFLGFGELQGKVWVVMFWIAFLFTGIQTVLKGFAMENKNRYLYYYMLLKPEHLFIAKCLYHTLSLFVLGGLLYGTLSVIGGNPFEDTGRFVLSLFAGALGVSLCFTFVSAIAVKSDQSTTLMTILAFPVIIPIFLHLLRMSKAALPDTMITDITGSLTTLGAIYLLLAGLGLLLFPYLWRS